MTRTIEYVRPKLYTKQRDAIFHDARFGMVEASTKAGKTVGCIAWLLEQAIMGKAGQNYWWIAPIFPQAKIAFRRLKRGLPAAMFTANETEMTITLPNGAVIWHKSADKPDGLYGEDVFAAVLDEASRMKEDAWTAIYSTLTATGGMARLIGNVKGKKNFFYRLCRKAQGGDKDMQYAKITAYDAVDGGVLKPEIIEAAKRDLPDHVFRELYLAEPSDDGGNPFGIDAIRRCITRMSKKKPVSWGWDLAKSYDWTVGIGLDEDGVVCEQVRFQKPWPETEQVILNKVGSVPTLIDSTGVGDPVLDHLQKNQNKIEGFKFTSTSKQQLMEGLQVAIAKQEVKFPDGIIVSELEQFEYEYTRTGVKYSAPEGLHDDCVCALALAVQQHHAPKPYFEILM